MSSKFRQRYLLLIVFFVVGLSVGLLLANYKMSRVLAKTVPSEQVIKTETSAVELETQGKYFYSLNQFEQAVSLWQQAAQIYADTE